MKLKCTVFKQPKWIFQQSLCVHEYKEKKYQQHTCYNHSFLSFCNILSIYFFHNKFILVLGSSVSSTEKDIDTWLTKAWTAIKTLLVMWKSDLTNKMKCSFFQAAVISILLYGCTTWTLTKQLEKKLDGNYTRMLWAILNKSWRQHPTKHQLYGHLPPISKLSKLDEPDMQDTAGEAGTSS